MKQLAAAAFAATLFVAAPAARAETIVVTTAEELQAALDGAADGDVIEVKKGTYDARTVREGDGFYLSERANITIRAKGKVKIDGFGEANCFEAEDVAGLTIEGVTFQNSSNDGIYMSGCSNFTARKCTFKNASDSGIEDRATDGYVIDDCKIIGCSWGLALGYASESFGVQVRNSSFKNCGNYAADLWASDAVFEDNVIKDCGTGVNIRDGFEDTTVRNNRISGGTLGIVVDGLSNTILLNEIQKPAQVGIELTGDGGHECGGNRVKKAGTIGVYATSTRNDIHDNVASKSGDVDHESQFSEESNTYTNNEWGTTRYPVVQN